jgi:hypothetical protein
MTTKKEAFMKSAEYLYQFFEDNQKTRCSMHLNLDAETVPGQRQVRWHLDDVSMDFASNYTAPKPPPPEGTHLKVWREDPKDWHYATSTGKWAGTHLQVWWEGNLGMVTNVRYWVVLREETP